MAYGPAMPADPDPRAAYDLTDRTAVVAGAASDIGAAISRALAAVGARVIVGDLDAPRLDAVAKAVREAGGEAQALVTDVTSSDSIDALVAAAGAQLDVMVNLAGVIGDAAVAETSNAVFKRKNFIEMMKFGNAYLLKSLSKNLISC